MSQHLIEQVIACIALYAACVYVGDEKLIIMEVQKECKQKMSTTTTTNIRVDIHKVT